MSERTSVCPQIIEGLDAETYHADTESVSVSGLKELARSPLHFWYKHLGPARGSEASTASQRLGTAIHMAVLEPERFEAHYLIAPEGDKRRKAVKDEWEQFNASLGDREPISAADWSTSYAIAQRIRSNAVGRELLTGEGSREVSVYWTDAETGVRCRMRPDFAPAELPELIDLKSCTDASERAFTRSAWNLGYHITAAWYTDGWKAATDEERGYVFAAWEKEPPYAVRWYYAEYDVLQAGREEYRRLLRQYAECRATDVWPGYEEIIVPLYLPAWASND